VEEEIVGVEFLILPVEISRTVDLVTAALGDDLDVAATASADRRVVKAGLYFELLNGLRRRRDVLCQCPLARKIGGIDAVEEHAAAGRPRAMDGRRYVSSVVRVRLRQIGGGRCVD